MVECWKTRKRFKGGTTQNNVERIFPVCIQYWNEGRGNERDTMERYFYREDRDSKKYVRVCVSRKTKVGGSGKSMERIGRTTSARSLERIREMGTDNLKPDDYVFCSPDGKPINDFREGFNTMLRLASE